ncbi:MAG: hypothetical protein ACRELB_23415 [Polyangiaceae bacterium]
MSAPAKGELGSKENPLERCACWACFARDGARLRIDKHGRPFIMCDACGSRTFTRSPDHVVGLRFVIELVQTALQQMDRDPNAHADSRRAAFSYASGLRRLMVVEAREGAQAKEGEAHVRSDKAAASG